MSPERKPRAFVYRRGVRIAGTIVACDASIGTDLVFLSHAAAVGARARRALPRLGASARVLCTDLTLALLGSVGDRLRRQALLPGYGRPFSLGGLRLELFPTGYMPGAAALLCERQGERTVYTGPLGPLGPTGPIGLIGGAPDGPGPSGAAVRGAGALCIDASNLLSDPEAPTESEALEAIGRQVRTALAAAATPVLLVEPLRTAMPVGLALAADRIPLRGDREIVQVAAAFRAAGVPAPRLERFSGRAGAGEVLLWPLGQAPPPRRHGSRPHRLIVVGGEARTDGLPERPDTTFVRYPTGPTVAALVRYVEATGARELAVMNGPPDDRLLEAFRERGVAVYPLGPPRQIGLFSGHGAPQTAAAL